MAKIRKNIFLDKTYPGVNLGALLLPDGILFIDAPPRPDDGRAWYAQIRKKTTAKKHLLVYLDSHPDRSLGARAMDIPALAHDETAHLLRQRSAIFKAQIVESGAEWEACSGLSGIRWLLPNFLFSQQAILQWGKDAILIEHHPGPEPGSTWVLLPGRKVVFVGDAVLLNQPPFLANADLETWIKSLDLLRSKDFKDYLILSSRGGKVSTEDLQSQRRHLRDVHKRLERIAKRGAPPRATEKLVPKLLAGFKFPAKKEAMYTQRLRYGLARYYAKKYHPAPPANPS